MADDPGLGRQGQRLDVRAEAFGLPAPVGGSDQVLESVVRSLLINPEGLPKVDTHRQVSVATGSKLVFVAGQVAWDAEGGRVGDGDVAAQVEQCYLNVATALAEVGASFDDVAKLTVYAVDLTPERMPLFAEGIARASAKLGATPMPPLTGIGVVALAEPGLLVEIEAIAMID